MSTVSSSTVSSSAVPSSAVPSSAVPEAERTQPVPIVPPFTAHESPPEADTTATPRPGVPQVSWGEQKRRFGGIRWGAAFFGWVTSMGMTVLLAALAVGIAAALTLITPGGPALAFESIMQNPGSARGLGLVGAAVLLVVLFAAFYCGGYVAGRMSRFTGVKQGIAVWVYGVAFAALVTVVASVWDAQLGGVGGGTPSLPVELSVDNVLLTLGGLAASLLGAAAGGSAGLRFHRKVDLELHVDATQDRTTQFHATERGPSFVQRANTHDTVAQ